MPSSSSSAPLQLRVCALAIFGVDTKTFPSLIAECVVGGLRLRTDEAVSLSDYSAEWRNGAGAMQFPLKDSEVEAITVKVLNADGSDSLIGSAAVNRESKYMLFPLVGAVVRFRSSASRRSTSHGTDKKESIKE